MRISNMIDFINKEKIPIPYESKFLYAHCNREELKKARTLYLKEKKKV